MTGPLAEGVIVDGKYRIEKFLGEGGMGIVYQAIEIELERHVAIKLLKGELTGNAQLVQRFRDELRVLASFNHPNITTLFTSFNWQGMPAMVMELVEGETFRNMVYRRGPIPEETSIPFVIQALQGVAEAHQRGIVHRDLKPENLMLNTAGQVKVMDFGIAKMEQTPGFTRTSAAIGTPFYMSPEQIDPHRFGMTRADARTDVYSMGVTLYEMLAGEVPFSGPSEFSIQRAHLEERPQPPTAYYPHIRPGVVAAVFKAMEKDPARRFQSAREFAHNLQAALAGAPAGAIGPVLPPTLPVKQDPGSSLLPPQLKKTAPRQPAGQSARLAVQQSQPDGQTVAQPMVDPTVAEPAFWEPSPPVSALDALLNRWFGHTGRPRLAGAVAVMLALCILAGGTAGLIALLRPNPWPASLVSLNGGGSAPASTPFTAPAQTPLPEPAETAPKSGSPSSGSGVDIHLPPPKTPPKTQDNPTPVRPPIHQTPSPQPAVAIAGIWTGSFTGCSGSGLTQAGMNLREASAGADDVVEVNGFMLVHTGNGNVRCGLSGIYRRANRTLVISSNCPASAPAFLSASHQSLLSIFGEGRMTGTVSPENCAVASFNKD
jgi:serine/threonine protein kinase